MAPDKKRGEFNQLIKKRMCVHGHTPPCVFPTMMTSTHPPALVGWPLGAAAEFEFLGASVKVTHLVLDVHGEWERRNKQSPTLGSRN